MRLPLLTAAALLVSAAAAAQPTAGPNPTRPTVSPYLNLLRPGNSAGVNYYGLVRPQTDARTALQQLQQQQRTTQAAVDQLGGAPAGATGHPVRYFDTARYYPVRPTGAAGAAGGATRPGGRGTTGR